MEELARRTIELTHTMKNKPASREAMICLAMYHRMVRRLRPVCLVLIQAPRSLFPLAHRLGFPGSTVRLPGPRLDLERLAAPNRLEWGEVGGGRRRAAGATAERMEPAAVARRRPSQACRSGGGGRQARVVNVRGLGRWGHFRGRIGGCRPGHRPPRNWRRARAAPCRRCPRRPGGCHRGRTPANR
jgi:hypothetical protein